MAALFARVNWPIHRTTTCLKTLRISTKRNSKVRKLFWFTMEMLHTSNDCYPYWSVLVLSTGSRWYLQGFYPYNGEITARNYFTAGVARRSSYGTARTSQVHNYNGVRHGLLPRTQSARCFSVSARRSAGKYAWWMTSCDMHIRSWNYRAIFKLFPQIKTNEGSGFKLASVHEELTQLE